MYSHLFNKRAANLILFETFFLPTCLIRIYMFIYFGGKFLPTRLLKPTCLFFWMKKSHLHDHLKLHETELTYSSCLQPSSALKGCANYYKINHFLRDRWKMGALSDLILLSTFWQNLPLHDYFIFKKFSYLHGYFILKILPRGWSPKFETGINIIIKSA